MISGSRELSCTHIFYRRYTEPRSQDPRRVGIDILLKQYVSHRGGRCLRVHCCAVNKQLSRKPQQDALFFSFCLKSSIGRLRNLAGSSTFICSYVAYGLGESSFPRRITGIKRTRNPKINVLREDVPDIDGSSHPRDRLLGAILVSVRL